MGHIDRFRLTCVGSITTAVLTLSGSALAAGPDPAQFADFHPNHTVIKCPFIPPGLIPPPCNGVPVTCVGTDGDDLILGTEAGDVMLGLGGNDVIHGDAGNDTICGGPGNDSIHGARDNDTLLGEDGDDWLFGAPGDDDLQGGAGNDVLWSGPGFDKMAGGGGDRDVCMLQKDLGEANPDCDTIYPPPGYAHDQDPDAGVLKVGKPK